ncbi:predicted protein [Scheffersomyces stipitis CBS 6054]|uniref:Uncharacterized protein n=1 Tax=Scheffersomyces stipitis (strain ATCC 58785 / CBS 6054 / NBRC 10063 / NRRL Y-11545) TaxID=322104 RepID=A3LYG1_PICST|nr:predicted protein [Scheffersomyces stipitis CBS 6054]ABN67629.1 predicted protein [Scheffersomyces stipitis CBS 6054]
MLRIGLSSVRGARIARAAPRVSAFRSLTTKTTITDHATGRVITLTDPNRPEIGDYPDFTPQLAQDKDPYAKYDDPQNRRNLNDPVSINDDLYDIWSPDYYQFVSDKTALKHNAIFFSLVFGFGATIWYFQLNPEKPAMPRSFPFGGLAKELGSGSAEDDYFYRVKADTTAEQELGFLGADNDTVANKDSYISQNSDFIKA